MVTLTLTLTLAFGVLSQPPTLDEGSLASIREQLAPMTGRTCDVGRLTREETLALAGALRHLRTALDAPAVQASLAARLVDAQETIARTRRGPAVPVLGYSGPGCAPALQAANAVTLDDGRYVLVARAYLASADERALARTMAHETAHVLGYGHQSDPTSYARSVPVLLGDAVGRFRHPADSPAVPAR